MRKTFLGCGVASSLLYAAMNAVVPLFYKGYRSASLTVSELSAVGTPTRSLWVALAAVYALLLVAFGWGIWQSAHGSRLLQLVGGVMIGQGVLGFFWPPMHQRAILAAGGGTLTDTMHIVFTAVWGLLALLAIVCGAAAFGTSFRLYSVATILVLFVFGGLTSADAPRLQANLPTPWIGVWERINIGSYLLWVAVFALLLMRRTEVAVARSRAL
ncbi:MAG TPA: DUF998 domain-containing protein [Fimbriimonadaceae bacterium]|nr:DUF998 domain-containing protein [Fimbriimonadaceae bacterium]